MQSQIQMQMQSQGQRIKALRGEVSPSLRPPRPQKPRAAVSSAAPSAEVGGDVCLWQTLAHSRNAHIRNNTHKRFWNFFR